MAEFLGDSNIYPGEGPECQRVPSVNGPGCAIGTRLYEPEPTSSDSEFAAFGKPVPMHRRANAMAHCLDMGLTSKPHIMDLVDVMAQQIERDEPYKALSKAMKYLDLTGSYRLLAVLCTGDDPEVTKPHRAIEV